MNIPITFGIPNTLAPPARRELRGFFVFASMGLLVLLLGLFPGLRPPPRMALPLALCSLVFPAWGLFRFTTRKSRAVGPPCEERAHGTRAQIRIFALTMIGAGVGFYYWAGHLGVSSPVIFGSLLIIEGLGGMIVSLTEWWRLSHMGVSSGLVVGGFLLPFAVKTSAAVPVGGAFLLGSLASAGILYCQFRTQQAELGASPNGGLAKRLNNSGVSGGPPSVS